jgi:hypothetical protein
MVCFVVLTAAVPSSANTITRPSVMLIVIAATSVGFANAVREKTRTCPTDSPANPWAASIGAAARGDDPTVATSPAGYSTISAYRVFPVARGGCHRQAFQRDHGGDDIGQVGGNRSKRSNCSLPRACSHSLLTSS